MRVTVGLDNQGGEGLSLSLSPRWGHAAAGGDALWREQVFGDALPEAAAEAWALDAAGECGSGAGRC